MSAFTSDWPRNWSRTSTQAVIVPATALMTATAIDAPSVSLSAATASGLDTESQNPPAPASVDFQKSAASGSTTTTVKNVVTTPRDRAAPALSLCARTRRGAATATSTSDATHLPLDLGHQALARVEEVLLHLRPAAEPELVDRELPRPDGELLPVLLEDALDDGPIAVVGEDLLCV